MASWKERMDVRRQSASQMPTRPVMTADDLSNEDLDALTAAFEGGNNQIRGIITRIGVKPLVKVWEKVATDQFPQYSTVPTSLKKARASPTIHELSSQSDPDTESLNVASTPAREKIGDKHGGEVTKGNQKLSPFQQLVSLAQDDEDYEDAEVVEEDTSPEPEEHLPESKALSKKLASARSGHPVRRGTLGLPDISPSKGGAGAKAAAVRISKGATKKDTPMGVGTMNVTSATGKRKRRSKASQG